jgi:arsenical pump membrane protein
MPLITSNPINILSADFFGYSFIQHLIFMGPIAIATIVSSLLLVYLLFHKKIPKTYELALADKLKLGNQTISPKLLRIILATLIAIDIGYVLTSLYRIPVSIIICSGATFLILTYWATNRKKIDITPEKKGLKQLAKEINWDIILFMLSIFLVVQGLENAKITQYLASALTIGSTFPSVLGIFIPSLIITIGASFMNNWPMTILGLLSITQANTLTTLSSQAFTGLVFSNVIGNNLGPHFFPLGSLAILMWIEVMRRKGVNISLKEYLKVGAILSIAEVAIASAVLFAEISLGANLSL